MVILDLIVPGSVGGREVITILLAIDPLVRSIVPSGYSTDTVMADYGKCEFSAVIAKPYRIRELLRIIRDILQE